MNKIEVAKAEAVIGGCEKVCTSTYGLLSTGGDDFSCVEIITCTDKSGETSSFVPADATLCGSL